GGLEEFGNYYLLEKVAVGGMAELFKARQRGVHDFEKIVAIKRILPHLSDNDEFVRMFIDEAKLAAQLTHPNIAQIFDLGKAMGFYYIAMEFVDGRDLRSLLRKVRDYRLPVPEPIAAAITMKVASALDYAHRKRGINDKDLKLVHRDISPQNILISYEGAVKLVDFGIAKAATKSTQTMAGALKGKLLYMSPEQALGQALDGRSDIFSLGLVLFELLTGERCFQADSELGVLEKVRMGKVQDLRTVNPAVSPEMGTIVAKALQKDADQRYLSARFLERDLRSLLARTQSEPTEHDVAEYVNTVLKGTRLALEELLDHRYPRPEPVTSTSPGTSPGVPAPAPGSSSPGSWPPRAPQAPGSSSPQIRPPAPAARPVAPPPPRPAPPQPPPMAVQARRQPYWLIPVVLGLIGFIAWTAFRAFN
ncbi:MAG TPA: protein kinase, partial [Holophaga sp.]|nr:protein kinase [Holophaga sp.]